MSDDKVVDFCPPGLQETKTEPLYPPHPPPHTPSRGERLVGQSSPVANSDWNVRLQKHRIAMVVDHLGAMPVGTKPNDKGDMVLDLDHLRMIEDAVMQLANAAMSVERAMTWVKK